MAAKTEFGVNGQIVRKLSTDSIAVGLMVPSEGRMVFNSITSHAGILVFNYLDAAGDPQTLAFTETEIPTERTVAFFWSDDEVVTESEITPVQTGFSPQTLTIPAHVTDRSFFYVWVSGAADDVIGKGVGQIQLTSFGPGETLFTGPTPLMRGAEAGNLWHIPAAQKTDLLEDLLFKISW